MTREEFVRIQARAMLRARAIQELERGHNLRALSHSISDLKEPSSLAGEASDNAFLNAEILFKIADEVAEEPL